MQVVLLKDVRRLGKTGELHEVADGYARNYLIPRGLAAAATSAARQQAAEQVVIQARQERAEQERAAQQATKMENIELVFAAKAGESGRLYGSITKADIAEQLAEKIGMDVDRRKIVLDEPIKELGTSTVEVQLHSAVSTTIKIIVEAQEE
jgi:large subunit ribosomal protein L9